MLNSYGNGLAETRTYDQDYRQTGITIPIRSIDSCTLGYNLDDDITGVTDNLKSSNGQNGLSEVIVKLRTAVSKS